MFDCSFSVRLELNLNPLTRTKSPLVPEIAIRVPVSFLIIVFSLPDPIKTIGLAILIVSSQVQVPDLQAIVEPLSAESIALCRVAVSQFIFGVFPLGAEVALSFSSTGGLFIAVVSLDFSLISEISLIFGSEVGSGICEVGGLADLLDNEIKIKIPTTRMQSTDNRSGYEYFIMK